eukprot:Skav211873  [mRNA]  locus=scaffold1431:346971:350822:+ [translate_table: standard]
MVEQKFNEAIQRIFQRWTTLALATEQGWGGRDSIAKGRQLQAEVVEYLSAASRKRRPPSWQNPGDCEDLAHYLYLRLDELFNTETDDGSPLEVATLCLRLFNSCQQGDVTFADQVLQACDSAPKADLSKSQGSERIEYATEEDELLDKLDGMDIDEENGEDDVSSEEEKDAMAAPMKNVAEPLPTSEGYPKRHEVPEPVVDEDGFTSVVKGRRKPR